MLLFSCRIISVIIYYHVNQFELKWQQFCFPCDFKRSGENINPFFLLLVMYFIRMKMTHETYLNLLKPNATIWWRRSESTLAQVMTCCLTTPSHYVTQYWLINSKGESHSSDGNITSDTSAISLEITDIRVHSNNPGANGLIQTNPSVAWINKHIFPLVKFHFCWISWMHCSLIRYHIHIW